MAQCIDVLDLGVVTEFCAEWWAQFIEIRCYLKHFWSEMQLIWTRYLLDWW
jgi:hypothetical protein